MSRSGAGDGDAVVLLAPRDPRAAQLASFFFRRAAPDPRILVRRQGELEAVDSGLAPTTDRLGLLDLYEAGSVVPTGKNNSGSVSRHDAIAPAVVGA
jgi:hypothetical protein